MNRAFWFAIAAATSVVSPLAAQEAAPSEPPAETPPENSEEGASDQPQTLLPSGMTADQFIQFFTLFSASEAMENIAAPAAQQLMRPGEKVEDWSVEGIDIIAALSALDGGLRGNLLRDASDEVLSVTDLSGTLAPDLSDFQSYALRPDPVGLVAERSFSSFLPGIWLETAMQRSQIGNALCYGGYFGITLHTTRPYSDWTEDELITTATIFALFDRVSALEFCVVYEKAGDGQYTARSFQPDGTRLPELDEDVELSVLMARDAVDAFLKRSPAVSATDTDE
ncbi:MAG: hypothetical protein QNI87_10275 [Erythrobacter sp.]|uniref:hypothetical protein n=1 Tax=Erythrobacter sp. TaxID=1042 RepID=UPI00260DD8B2|nr:hypothetical protein [Erythrobacter sp.]MDJ0978911.1 hypothetical protein [Erythrobacter sp.]